MNALLAQPVSTTAAHDAVFDAVVRSGARRTGPAAQTAAGGAVVSAEEAKSLRQNVGEFVGNVFYGTLLRQMQNSNLKGKYLHGGRGEEVFRGQLHMEYAKRMGRSPNDPISNRIYDSMMRERRIAADGAIVAGRDALEGSVSAR